MHDHEIQNLPARLGHNGGGRKHFTIDDLPPDWKDMMLLAYRQGASDVEVRIMLALAMDTISFSETAWYGLIERDEGFAEAVEFGKNLSQVWWEQAGRANLTNRSFQFATYAVNMRNRFNWRITDKEFSQGNKIDNSPSVVIYLPDNGRNNATQQEIKDNGKDDEK